MKPEETRTYKDLVEVCNSGMHPKFVFFWGHTPRANGVIGAECFSQWYASSFEINSKKYPTAEHYMMEQKAILFGDEDAAQKILMASNPGKAKAIGRLVRGFQEEIWENRAFEIVVTGNLAKFSQNKQLLSFLLGTKSRVLVEASPRDRIWGIGMSKNEEGIDQPIRWKGLNKLGFALMETRLRLRNKSNQHQANI